ncbi:MAG: calcium-binding protein [Nostoc sp.]
MLPGYRVKILDGNAFPEGVVEDIAASGYDYDYDSQVYSRTSSDNTLNECAGSDRLIVESSSGDNLLDGGDGNDTLISLDSIGKNTLKGGNGNDTLTGGKGNDSLYGGGGIDTFVFNSFNQGSDRIYDFNATNEVIQVSAAGFGGGLSPGVLKTSQFKIGTSATTTSQRFIYNNTTGALFFDSDGSAGAFTQVQFAQLTAGLSLTNNNFVIV